MPDIRSPQMPQRTRPRYRYSVRVRSAASWPVVGRREASLAAARVATVSYSARLTMAGCIGSGDQIHSLGGLIRLPALLRARRFHTM